MLLPSKMLGPRQLSRSTILSFVRTENPILYVTAFHVFLKLSSSSAASDRNHVHCYRTLEVPVDCTFDEVREAFIALAKKYHPDGGSPDADAKKFHEVESAYRTLQMKYSCEEKLSKAADSTSAEVTEHDIQHTAPQHRQYLSFDGCGVGTPSQRQKQYQRMRAVQAADNLISHRIRKVNSNTDNYEKALAVKDKVEARKIKTRFGMDRLVEDLIQESMARGEFDNLSGKGKPLKRDNYNPYVDFVTHKLNEVLIENGFTPEWITLQKEIRTDREAFRAALYKKRKCLGPVPLSETEQETWQNELHQIQPFVNQINSKINKYNLLVPILYKQMLQIQLEREAKDILENGEVNLNSAAEPQRKSSRQSDKHEGLLEFISSLLGGK